MPLPHASLRLLLTAPYVALVLLAAAVIGGLSYRASSDAVDNLSGQLLSETVLRIGQAVDRHVSGSAAVLEAAFPEGIAAPSSIEAALPALRTRFWLATSVHRDPNNYAYYGDRQGRFFGLWRYSDQDAELRLRHSGSGPRQIHRFRGIQGELAPAVAESRIFEPRERPWYLAAREATSATWTSIYIDFKTTELVATRARRVNDAQGNFEGVVATDLSLRQVNAFLQRLPVSANGLAMVTERDGRLIGVSRGPHLQKGPQGSERINALQSQDPLVAETYRAVQSLVTNETPNVPRTTVFRDGNNRLVQVGYARLRDDAGLDWSVIVAVPRSDFLFQVEAGFRQAGWLAAVAALGVVLLGLGVLGTVTRELKRLKEGIQRVALGDLSQPIASERRDELGDLARSVGHMQQRLLTDSLTGLSNREAVVRRIEERLAQSRRRDDKQCFAVIFADLNNFKRINDSFGHEVGDRVLREMAARLRAAVRASDLVARFAGDEFVVLLDAVASRQDALAVREHLSAAMRQPLESLAGQPPVPGTQGAACGLAVFPQDGQDVETLLRHADADMYREKIRPV